MLSIGRCEPSTWVTDASTEPLDVDFASCAPIARIRLTVMPFASAYCPRPRDAVTDSGTAPSIVGALDSIDRFAPTSAATVAVLFARATVALSPSRVPPALPFATAEMFVPSAALSSSASTTKLSPLLQV